MAASGHIKKKIRNADTLRMRESGNIGNIVATYITPVQLSIISICCQCCHYIYKRVYRDIEGYKEPYIIYRTDGNVGNTFPLQAEYISQFQDRALKYSGERGCILGSDKTETQTPQFVPLYFPFNNANICTPISNSEGGTDERTDNPAFGHEFVLRER